MAVALLLRLALHRLLAALHARPIRAALRVARHVPVLVRVHQSAMVRVLRRRARATASHAVVARHAKINPCRAKARSPLYAPRATASLSQRSCTKSQRSTASRLPSNWTSCQHAHAVKNRPC